MQGLVNDFVRYFIAVGIRLVGLVLNQAQRVRIIPVPSGPAHTQTTLRD